MSDAMRATAHEIVQRYGVSSAFPNHYEPKMEAEIADALDAALRETVERMRERIEPFVRHRAGCASEGPQGMDGQTCWWVGDEQTCNCGLRDALLVDPTVQASGADA